MCHDAVRLGHGGDECVCHDREGQHFPLLSEAHAVCPYIDPHPSRLTYQSP